MPTVATLTAQFRADTSDLERGGQVARKELQATEQQAKQAARALEIMAQAASKANPGQGSAPQILEIFQKANVQPTAAALSQAAQEMQKTSAAAAQAAQPTQALARATAEHAGAARGAALAHREITETARLSETSVVRFAAAMTGVNLGLSVAAGAGRLLHDNIQASLEAAINLDRVGRGLAASYGGSAGQMSAFAQRLAPQAATTAATVGQALTAAAPLTQYGITTAQTQALTSRAADIAGRYGQPFDRVASEVLEAVRTGGNQLEQYGIKLDDARIKTEAYGGALSGTFDRMTTAQQIGVRYNVLLDQTRDLQGSAATSADTLSGSFDRLGSSLDRLRERSGALTTGGLQGPAGALASWADQIIGTGSGGDRRSIVPDQRAPGGYRFVGGQTPQFDIPAILAANGMNQTTTPPSFIGPIPFRGTDLARVYAGNAQTMAGRAQAEAQAQLTALELQSEQRRLSVAEELAGYRQEELETAGRLAPLLLQQANLQDRITQASRDNLQLRRALISAQQAELPTQFALSGIDYAQRRLELRAEVSRASVRRGGAPTEDIADLRAQYRNFELGRPELELQDLDQKRAVDVVQQQITQQDLARQQRLTDLEQEERALQDQTIPLQEHLRLEQAREAVVQRTVDLADLANTKSLTTAQLALNEANAVRLIADDTARLADEYAAGLRFGVSALERSAAALVAARDAVKDAVPLLMSLTPDNQARIANGLGAGGLGPTTGTPVFSPVFNITGTTREDIKQQVSAALDQVFAGAATSGPAAPSSVAGAGR